MVFRFIIDSFCIDILIRYLNILFVNAEIQTSTAYCLLFKVEAISSLFLRRSKEGNVPTASQRHHFKVTFCQFVLNFLWMDVLDACQLGTMIKMIHIITQYYSENIFPDMDILDAWLP